MKQSLTLIPTLREMPSDIEVKSHKMLLRAGFLRQSTSGVYSYLPLAKRVLNKLEKMISEEMERLGAIEITLPSLQPKDILQHSFRFHEKDEEVLQLKDRNERQLILAPSHEEVMTQLMRDEIKSYKKLPITFYQIQSKFRDESRPRYGLLRSKEFLMKAAYSYHATEESLEATYLQMSDVYSSILSRLGLYYEMIDADTRTADGLKAHEFIVASDIGETTIAYSDESNYASNIEITPVVTSYPSSEKPMNPLEKVETPQVKTIEEVCSFFTKEQTDCMKSIVFKVDGEFVVVLVRGDHQINPIKLRNALKAQSLTLATEEEIEQLLGCTIGSIGPIKLPVNVKVIADLAIQSIRNGIAGANEDGYHYINVNPERDFAVNSYEDIRYIQEGDPSPDGNGTIRLKKGIEVGHIRMSGTWLTEKFNANFIDENGQSKPMYMGSFGLGISRLLAVMAEIYQDENGFVWPKQFSPYDIHLIPVNIHDEVQFDLASQLYHILTSYHFDVLFDDRDERAGVKFIDSDLIGLPVRVTIGKRASEGIVEVKIRRTGEIFEWAKEELIDRLNEYFRSH
ncbi:proline--tRNA ligase [Lysinibacillus halotolerans]|uniref:Proline--tRNA ligase n=1 Tax=Lysinibacillus halotolerans TaxID=1368476 RepID=A0A3M8HH94_9BACI|nr:proline--tRNA ligase [Lysinibacillus halotolerans]RND01745.1 proline--tRNA ligase [Lysinibacillus halotolerans]